MKLKRLISLGLAIVLAVSLTLTPASAVTFSDVESHWAKDYIVKMADAGLFTGYEDGTFRPDGTLTAAEALSLCARVASTAYDLNKDDIQKMQQIWQEKLEQTLGSGYSWFYDEAAVALETGVLSWTDLVQRAQAKAMGAQLQKELFSVYLVRAMGLNNLAQSLSVYTLEFADAAAITKNYEPYVYLLATYGVLTGDENKKFNPAQPVNRAVSSTMLSRILDYIDLAALRPELADYTDYAFAVGMIGNVAVGEGSAVELQLSNDLAGDRKVTVPGGAEIYKNDRLAQTKDLKAGLFARVCFDGEGDVSAVRLYDASGFATVSGQLVGVSGDTVTIREGSKDVAYTLDRFTQVRVGGVTGDRNLIDAKAGYTRAVIQYNEGKTALSLQLYGGTHEQTGLLGAVTAGSDGGYDLQVVGFDGVNCSYTVVPGAQVTINGLAGALKSSHEGSYIKVQVSNDEPGQAAVVAVDTLTKYIQGSIGTVNYGVKPGELTVKNLETEKVTAYLVPEDAEIFREGKPVQFKQLVNTDFVTLKLGDDGQVQTVDSWPGTVNTAGELTKVVYGTAATVLTVVRDDGVTVEFTLDMQKLPEIKREGAASSIAKLCVGDRVTVTVRYQQVIRIAAEMQSANASGVIETVTHASGVSTLTVTLDNGETRSYTVSDAAALKQNGKAAARTALQPGYRLSMVISGDQIVSAEIKEAVTTTAKITGTVLYADTAGWEILLRTEGETVITVKVDSATRYTLATGEGTALRNLKAGDTLLLYGRYSGGEFNADLIIVE